MGGKRGSTEGERNKLKKKKTKKVKRAVEEEEVEESEHSSEEEEEEEEESSDDEETAVSAAKKPASAEHKSALSDLGKRISARHSLFNLPQCYKCSKRKEAKGGNTCVKLEDGVILKFALCGHACLGGAQERIIVVERMEEAKAQGILGGFGAMV